MDSKGQSIHRDAIPFATKDLPPHANAVFFLPSKETLTRAMKNIDVYPGPVCSNYKKMMRKCTNPLRCLSSHFYCNISVSGDNAIRIFSGVSGKFLPRSVHLTKEDFDNGNNCSLNNEGSPSVTTQLQVLNHSLEMASSCLLSGDDIADLYVFKKAYQKYFHVSEEKKDNSTKAVSCFIQLANKKRTKICLYWLPPNLSKLAIHKIVTAITGNENYNSYIHNVGNRVRILIHSEALSAEIPHYVELWNQDNDEKTLISISVKYKYPSNYQKPSYKGLRNALQVKPYRKTDR